MSHVINQLRKNGVMYYCIKYFVGRPFHLLKYAYYLFWELVDKDAITVSAVYRLQEDIISLLIIIGAMM